MKVIEQIVSADKSKITEVVSVGKKKYKRIIVGREINWKRFKTGHQVKQSELEFLEAEYNKNCGRTNLRDPHFSGYNMHASGSTTLHEFLTVPEIMDDKERRRIERGLLNASDDGNKKLAAIKYVKEQTNWGLRESKDFVDAFFERRKSLKFYKDKYHG